MKRAAIVWLLLCAAQALAQPAQQAGAETAVGEWWTPGFSSRVRIDACGDALCGRIVWMWDEAPKDIADKSPLVGRPVIAGMRSARPGHWNGGRLYNPEDGRDYTGSITLRSPDTLVVDGCVLFICRTQVWRRFDPGHCPPVAARSAGVALAHNQAGRLQRAPVACSFEHSPALSAPA